MHHLPLAVFDWKQQDCGGWSIMLAMNRPTPLAFFSICAVVDFVLGLVKWHSVVAGIVAIVCGLPLTGVLFLGFRASWKSDDDSGAPAPRDKARRLLA